jgi:hypothetical protein
MILYIKQVLQNSFLIIYKAIGQVLLAGLNTKKTELASTDAGNLAFVQAGTGVSAKIRFPSLRNTLCKQQ